MSKKNVAVIPGDGIGPEVIKATLEVLEKVAPGEFDFKEVAMGGNAIDKYGEPLPDFSLKTCQQAEATLLGAVGGPKWDNQPPEKRPERGLLGVRAGLEVFANIRPAKIFAPLASACPLRKDIAEKGIDFIIVRELTGGIYFGKHEAFKTENGERAARDVMEYTEHEIRRIAHVAFKMAMGRRKIVTSIDKANILTVSRLWREIVEDVAKEYPEVKLNHLYVDNASMQLIRVPSEFDVIVTENTFGDILSDEASQIVGSIGMIPSASLGEGNRGLYEPIHGSAPDIAGQDKANPIGTILAGAMMLRYSFNMNKEADKIENAVDEVLKEGLRTGDIYTGDSSEKLISGSKMRDEIMKKL
ncbi:MAG: 3-isopropylmalate dehydrogenase [Synergistaceae bacterium]|nr:3-isopropylmalate dehydrogenase [Synergistaceae bacterium]MBR2208217.1 3-isopropylmalate dehydrogenase [Synergistaceae bacterium]